MIIARTLQTIGVLALIGAALIALDAREIVTERIAGITVTEARWSPATLLAAGQATVASLILIGLGSGLADLRLIRNAAEVSDAVPARRATGMTEERELRLRRSAPPHDVAARVLVGHSGGGFTAQQIQAVTDAVEGHALRDGRTVTRVEADQEAVRVLNQVWRSGERA